MRKFSTFTAILMIFFFQGCEVLISNSTSASEATGDSGDSDSGADSDGGGSSDSGGDSDSSGDSGSGGGSSDSGGGSSAVLSELPGLDTANYGYGFWSFDSNLNDSLDATEWGAGTKVINWDFVDTNSSAMVTVVSDPDRGNVANFPGDRSIQIDPTPKDGGGYDYPFRFGHENFALGFWFKTSATGLQYMLDNRTPTNLGRDYTFIRMNAGIVTAVFTTDYGGSCQTTLTSTDAYNDGNWHHLVWNRNNKRTGQLYIDGVIVAEDTYNGGCSAGGADPQGPLYLGANQGSSDFFNGKIDSMFWVRFTNQTDTLDASDVSTIMDNY